MSLPPVSANMPKVFSLDHKLGTKASLKDACHVALEACGIDLDHSTVGNVVGGMKDHPWDFQLDNFTRYQMVVFVIKDKETQKTTLIITVYINLIGPKK